MADKHQSNETSLLSERRIQVRQRVLLSCLELGEDNGGIVLNISQGGLALQAIAELIDDESPKMRFQLSQSQTWVEAKGRIAWRSDSKKAVGVEFIALPDEAREQIQAWIFLTSDLSEFHENTVPLEKTEQLTAGLAAAESTSETPVPEPEIVGPTRENRSGHPISTLSPSTSEMQYGGKVSNSAETQISVPVGTRNLTSDLGKSRRLAGLWLAAVLLLLAFVSLNDYLQERGNSRKNRERKAGVERSAFSSKSSVIPPTPPSHPKPASDLPTFMLQVSAMDHEQNALALATSLRQSNFPAFIFKRTTDAFYRVLVGPYKDEDSTARAKIELEKQGFKAIRAEWKSPTDSGESAAGEENHRKFGR